jgi:uncharacterized protein (DUF952 family)
VQSAGAEQADLIYKILSVADWAAAQQAGRFEGSADDRRDGFIHFSDGGQVIGTARKYFAGQTDLVVLAVDPALLADLRWERSRDDALFPHLYGPLNLDAVAKADRLPDDLDAADAIADLLGRLPHPALGPAGRPAWLAGESPVGGLVSRRKPGQAAPGMIRQLLVAVATTLPAASKISAWENATRRPGLTTVPTARRAPLALVTGRV